MNFSWIVNLIRPAVFFLSCSFEAKGRAPSRRLVDKKELRPPAPGAMCYRLSSMGHLSDAIGAGLPHLMFYLPRTDGAWRRGGDGGWAIDSRAFLGDHRSGLAQAAIPVTGLSCTGLSCLRLAPNRAPLRHGTE